MEIENQDESIEQPVRRGILESRRTRSADVSVKEKETF